MAKELFTHVRHAVIEMERRAKDNMYGDAIKIGEPAIVAYEQLGNTDKVGMLREKISQYKKMCHE